MEKTVTKKRDCVISGAGPAGMVLAYLLARKGIQVTVLEKHSDFFRDFRGDTIHPSTLAILRQLGIIEEFLKLPITRLEKITVNIQGQTFTMADFGSLPKPDAFIAIAPQWDFLDFLAQEAQKLPNFELLMGSEVQHVIKEKGRVVGIKAQTQEGDLEIRAALTVAADGRKSRIRDCLACIPQEHGVPIDVLWFRIPQPAQGIKGNLGFISQHGLLITIDRKDYYQAGRIIPKGHFEQIKNQGLEAFKKSISATTNHLEPVLDSLTSWDQIKLLSVQINRLQHWYQPGCVFIGDAAHAMSPVFGVGVNYAIQDAVALANLLSPDFLQPGLLEEKLACFQTRREKPVKKMQAIQILVHGRIKHLAQPGKNRLGLTLLKLLLSITEPYSKRKFARFVGFGFLPERVN